MHFCHHTDTTVYVQAFMDCNKCRNYSIQRVCHVSNPPCSMIAAETVTNHGCDIHMDTTKVRIYCRLMSQDCRELDYPNPLLCQSCRSCTVKLHVSVVLDTSFLLITYLRAHVNFRYISETVNEHRNWLSSILFKDINKLPSTL